MRWALWKRVLVYGALLAAGTVALQWIDTQRLARANTGDVYLFLVAAGFLAPGVYIGVRVIARPVPSDPAGNPQALAQLGISPRELSVLTELAAGRSNKEIAQRLAVSPNTVKTHVAQVYRKLGAARRTDAVNRARELGILP